MKLLAVAALALLLAGCEGSDDPAERYADRDRPDYDFEVLSDNEHVDSESRSVGIYVEGGVDEGSVEPITDYVFLDGYKKTEISFFTHIDGEFAQFASVRYNPDQYISFNTYVASSTPAQNSNRQGCDSPSTAYRMAKRFVESQLTSPSTAEFPSIISGDVNTSYLGNCTHRITSYVDSQNGYGAMVRTHFSATVQKEEGTSTWVLKDLSTQ